MKFSSEYYLEASQERMNTARILYNACRHAAAVYFSGVAVESLLRAYLARKNKLFDSRHDLGNLLIASSVADFIPHPNQRKFSTALSNLWARWKNNYRYASQNQMRSEFKRLKLHVGIKGDFVKYNSMIAVDCAEEIITLGVRRWDYKRT
jgi:hypothetical protein